MIALGKGQETCEEDFLSCVEGMNEVSSQVSINNQSDNLTVKLSLHKKAVRSKNGQVYVPKSFECKF